MAGTSQMITARPSAIAGIRWYEYVSRFVFGGLATAVASVIAKEYGPSVGGLFLAFPAIFPASATLIEQNEKRRKQGTRGHGTLRGRRAAALDAALGWLAVSMLAWKLWYMF